jgi:hypothetical protein
MGTPLETRNSSEQAKTSKLNTINHKLGIIATKVLDAHEKGDEEKRARLERSLHKLYKKKMKMLNLTFSERKMGMLKLKKKMKKFKKLREMQTQEWPEEMQGLVDEYHE